MLKALTGSFGCCLLQLPDLCLTDTHQRMHLQFSQVLPRLQDVGKGRASSKIYYFNQVSEVRVACDQSITHKQEKKMSESNPLV